MAGRRRSHDVALARARYLGEAAISVRYVVGSNRTPVIDECSPAQQSVRTLLALLTFNYMTGETYTFNCTPAAYLTLYSFVLSPRRDALVIVSKAPDNIALRLLDAHVGFRFAGEAVTAAEEYVYRLDHPALGTAVTVSSDKGTLDGVCTAVREDLPPFSRQELDAPLTREEHEAVALVDGLESDIRALLAALFVRLTSSDRRSWAVGTFWADPLKRPPAAWWEQHSEPTVRRLLRGAGGRWELRWNGPPFPSDIVSALVHPRCGLRGATASGEGREYDVAFGSARLLLRPF